MRRLARFVLGRGGKKEAAPGPAIAPSVLMFDFDGTIADTFASGLQILNELAAEFSFSRLEAEDVPKARDMSTRQLMKFLGVRATQMPRISRRGTEKLLERIDAIRPIPGMPEALRTFRDRGYDLGIVTSNTGENVRRVLANHGLDFFSFVSSSSRLLGKAREIKKVMRARGIDPAEVLFIGDEMRDIEAAQKAGIRVAAVTWGYNSIASLEALKPDHLIHSTRGIERAAAGLDISPTVAAVSDRRMVWIRRSETAATVLRLGWNLAFPFKPRG